MTSSSELTYDRRRNGHCWQVCWQHSIPQRHHPLQKWRRRRRRHQVWAMRKPHHLLPLQSHHAPPTHQHQRRRKQRRNPDFPCQNCKQRKLAGGGMCQPRNGQRGRRRRKSSGTSPKDVHTWDPAAPGAPFLIPHSRRFRTQPRT
jgi:hypothetical protein